MAWAVLEHPLFAIERSDLPESVADKLDEILFALSQVGPAMGRPLADTLKGSRYANMKEIRLSEAKGVWRFAFAFDPMRNAVVLVGGQKQGVSQQKFYRDLIRRADERFDDWLEGNR